MNDSLELQLKLLQTQYQTLAERFERCKDLLEKETTRAGHAEIMAELHQREVMKAQKNLKAMQQVEMSSLCCETCGRRGLKVVIPSDGSDECMLSPNISRQSSWVEVAEEI